MSYSAERRWITCDQYNRAVHTLHRGESVEYARKRGEFWGWTYLMWGFREFDRCPDCAKDYAGVKR